MSIMQIKVIRARKMLKVDIDRIPNHLWYLICERGLKDILNGGASMLSPTNCPDGKERARIAMEIANGRLNKLYDGTLRIYTDSIKRKS